MDVVSYEELFTKDLGEPSFKYAPSAKSEVAYEASVWSPVMTLEGIWGGKIIVTEGGLKTVSVFPGDGYLEAILRIAKFLQEKEEKFLIVNLPKIIFPFE